jgi:endonuclease/exonuclease/phosphatase family metal-dependent hydrolase
VNGPASSDTVHATRELRLLFWNVFLLKPRLVPGGPGLPAIGELAAPAVAERATQIGAALAGEYDVAAFAEAFEPAERARLLAAWDGRRNVSAVVGPERSFPPFGPAAFATSGLLTVVDGLAVTRIERHTFATRGSRVHDADAWANKGVLFVEVDPGLGGPCLEIATTHLIWGTGLIGGRHAEDPARRHALRMAQVDELVAFVERVHRPGNALVVAGDFNVVAHDEGASGGPERWYRDLTARLGRLHLVDTWAAAGVGPGPTCGENADPFDDEDPAAPGFVRDDPDAELGPEQERIDYVFVRDAPEDRLRATVERPRRRAFPRSPGSVDYQRLARLSDHLALSVVVKLSTP